VVTELAELGCESITLSGGEPLLRQDWQTIAAAIRSHSMRVELITNGLLVAEQANAIQDAGLTGVTFSIDGPEDVHDSLRGVAGCLQRIWLAARRLRERGLKVGAVTQINRLNRGSLPEIQRLLEEHGFDGWQLQLTMPHGRARLDAQQLCLSAKDLPELEPEILDLRSHTRVPISVGDNIGYMSRNEPQLRSCSERSTQFWAGCQAGLSVIGIASDGNVRGCLSQPTSMNEGNLRDRRLTEIWNDPRAFSYNRQFDVSQLQGTCANCAFGCICRGGCRSLAAAVSPNEPFSNPYCTFALSR
jgi:radical SAM protein with 4Fe4S-binding SPASM domain